MNILIVGCSRLGQQLAHTFELLGHDVSVLAEDTAHLAPLQDFDPPFSGLAVAGVPIDVDSLRSAGIEACDAVAAVTREDNVNIMVAQIAREIFNVQNVIARVMDPACKEVYSERFGLRSVCDTNLTAQAVITSLLKEQNKESQCVAFGSSTANFSAIAAEKQLYNRPLSEAAPPRPNMLIFGVQRASGVLELASTQPVIHVGDKIIYSELAD